MRRLSTLLLLSVACFACSETIHLTASVKGKTVGAGLATRTIGADKSAMTQIRLDLMQNGVPISIDGVTHYDGKCRPVNGTLNIKQGGQAAMFTATYYNGGVRLHVVVQNRPIDKNIPYASKMDIADNTNRWFVAIQPKPGDSVSYQGFDTLKGRWRDIKITYVGTSTITIDKHKVAANLLRRQADGKTSERVRRCQRDAVAD